MGAKKFDFDIDVSEYKSPYFYFLLLLAFLRVLDYKSLCYILNSAQLSHSLVFEASKKGHISWIQVKSQKKALKEYEFFILTAKGIQYLLQNRDAFPEVFGDEENFKIFSPAEEYKECRERMACTNSALAFAYRAGARIPACSLIFRLIPENPEKGMFLRAFLEQNIDEEALRKLGLFKATQDVEDITFFSGYNVKARAGMGNSLVTFNDFSSGRYRGVIDSPYRSVFLYVSNSRKLFWQQKTVNVEQASYVQWLNGRRDTSRSLLEKSGSAGALIVESAQDFRELYKMEYSKLDKQSFGGRFKHFYILPHDRHGVSQLRRIITSPSDESLLEHFKSAVLKTAAARPNPKTSIMFPLLDSDSRRACLGFTLDAKFIQNLEGFALKRQTEEFCIFCFEWQEPFFREVLPENVHIKSFKQE